MPRTKLSYRGAPRRPVYFVAVAAFTVAACAEQRSQIYTASLEGGDYAVLSCDELSIAQRTIAQRLSGSVNYSTEGEPSGLLGSQGRQIADVRAARNCPGATVEIEREPAQVVVAPEPEPKLAEPAFLQVATFLVEPLRDATVKKLRAQGFTVETRPIRLAGETFHRVIVGPLETAEDVARIQRAALQMGFDDAFFVKG